MDPSVRVLRLLLSLLRAQYHLYQGAHWEMTGPQFYGDHLMFERLYKSVRKQVDALAEKMIGMFDPSAVQLVELETLTLMWVKSWCEEGDFIQRALRSENDFEKVAKVAYALLKKKGQLTMGMDDYLMALVNSHETHRYLLLQRQRT